MKIYRVVCYDRAYEYYHYATKKEAVREARLIRKMCEEEGREDMTVDIEVIDVEPTREGIAAALQALVDFTCMNEH